MLCVAVAIPTPPTLPRWRRHCLKPLLLLLNPMSTYGRLVDSATPVFILDDPDTDVTWRVNHLVRVAFASFGTNASVTFSHRR
jgi:hypothetical protein